MRLRPGTKFYERNDVIVRDKRTGRTGLVTRACPSGRNIPACAHILVLEEGEQESFWGWGQWVPTRDLERVG